jgi:hypothetical protein
MENSPNSEEKIDYIARRLDFCGVCKQKYNVGDRIPRILVNCGHTYCTSCLTKYFRKNRIRCPFCTKLVKKLENVELLPLNINIFAEVVNANTNLLKMLDTDSDNSYFNECTLHAEKQMHFYCPFHDNNFCRDCMKTNHKDSKCCVVELFDINKLYQLNDQNQNKNKNKKDE